MQRVTLYLTREDAPGAALALGGLGIFEPGDLPREAPLDRGTGRAYRASFASASGRLDKISAHFGVQPAPAAVAPRVVGSDELRELDEWLGDTWRACSAREERAREIAEAQRAVTHLGEVLDAYEPLDIDLGLLQREYRFLDLRLGTVRSEGVSQLRDALGLLGASLQAFPGGERTRQVLIAAPREIAAQVDRVLAAASFSQLNIPPEFAAHPREVRRRLEQRAAELQAQSDEQDRQRDVAGAECTEGLAAAAAVLDLAASYARLSGTLARSEGLVGLAGWVPAEKAGDIGAALRRELGDRFVLEIRAPLAEELSAAPSALRHPAWLAPFATLVRTYGVPRYGEFDPTWLFAVSFVMMFGMMFGDVGHGAVIVGAGLLWRRSLRGFTPFVVAIGTASIAFGFTYGSVFGYEELIHPLWIAPLSDPERMLRLALYWGVGFIVVTSLITIRNRWREGARGEALLSGRGLAGAVLYLAVLLLVWRVAGGHAPGAALWAGVLVPLALILIHEWQHSDAPTGERAVIVFIEAFETLIGFAANTLSFLRVAAFSLNHVALAIAVFTIADRLGTTGYWLTVVLGNVFILVLEGAIVTIQVLRLEYYEGFSRFFSGDGRAFRPLTLDARQLAGSATR